MKKKIYIASPLFSASEIAFNKKLKCILEPYFSVYLPQEDGGLVTELVKKGISIKEAGLKIFHLDIDALDKADLILINLDGRSIDEGAIFELGYMFGRNKRCFGLQTDTRKPFLTGNNPMIEFSCEHIFSSINEFKIWAKNQGENQIN